MNYNEIKRDESIIISCPYCDATKCQFWVIPERFSDTCKVDDLIHTIYSCSNCHGRIVTLWDKLEGVASYQLGGDGKVINKGPAGPRLVRTHPSIGEFQPSMNLELIENTELRKDFVEAISCFNNGFYNACMIMARRAIQTEVDLKNATGSTLPQKIDSLGISSRLKELLTRVKNFGNYGAHPDFCLYDDDGNEISDDKELARWSLYFLDKYFDDQYDIPDKIRNAPSPNPNN